MGLAPQLVRNENKTEVESVQLGKVLSLASSSLVSKILSLKILGPKTNKV